MILYLPLFAFRDNSLLRFLVEYAIMQKKLSHHLSYEKHKRTLDEKFNSLIRK